MIELQGKYGFAKIFTDLVDNESISQVYNLLNQKFVENSKIRMMPDIHAGAGCTIGTTMTITGKCCPNLVGVDIGCGMTVVELVDKSIDFAALDKFIREKVPSGFCKRPKEHRFCKQLKLKELRCADQMDLDNAYKSLGTLGGGNHFIEVNRDDNGILYLVVHTGSRHLGLEVAKHYQKIAVKQCEWNPQAIIDSLKSQGREADIQNELAKAKTSGASVPKELAYVSGYAFDDYLHDIKIIQEYAELNRAAIIDEIVGAMPLRYSTRFTTIHNYIDVDDMILRKGAVRAKAGEKLIIPMNMRDGSLICEGLGNPDWNYSAPHGAGRLMSRSQAKQEFALAEYEKSMSGIYTTSVSSGTLDECPMVYKPMESIVNNIRDTVNVLKVIKPVYNFKASE